MATIKTDMELYLGYMKTDESVDNYLKLFQSQVDTILAHVGAWGQHNGLHPETFARMNPEVTQKNIVLIDATTQAQMTAKSQEAQQEDYLVCLLLRQLFNAQFSKLKTKLTNEVLVRGKNSTVVYPTTLDGIARLLHGHKNSVRNHGGGGEHQQQ